MRKFPLFGNDSLPDSPFAKIQDFGADRQHTLSTVAITAATIDERELKLQRVSGVTRLVTKIDGVLYSVVLS